MNTMPMKNWAHKVHVPHMHVPNRHDMTLRMEHLVHDPRFWAIAALVAVTAFIITLAVLTSPQGTNIDITPLPNYPYIF